MARKKVEVQLLREIESQEEWEDIMGKEGMWVVDVYQEWSGPCDAMVSNFRRIKNELGDDLLHFAMAKSDTIEALEKYRGSCEPCFLFFAAGVLVSYVHGANAPLILRTLTEQLAQEHKVIDGSAERKEVKDPFIANREAADDAMKDDEGDDDESDEQKFQYNGEVVIFGDDLTPAERFEEVPQGYTVAIIKPNVVAEGKVDEILEEMKKQGIQVIAQEERKLTEEEAREFYGHLQDEEYFEDLTKFMSSGPSHVLVLTKGQEDDSVIKDWRDMLGPPTVEDAKEHAPDCLRARFGKAGLMNALHGSDSRETAARELGFFFPHMSAPTIQKKKKEIQRTLALIRPDAFASNRDAILQRVKESGFQIALQKEVMLTKEQAEEFYREHADQPYFEELTNRMSSGPLLALGLAREDAVKSWRGMLGPADVEAAKAEAPDSLRAQFAVEAVPLNQLHGSDSLEAAQKEINFFFPVEQTVAMIKPDAFGTKDAIIDKIHQAGFRIAARKETTITRDIAESFYADQKGKDYFESLVEHMTSGPTMFMVLSREGAVEGWRQEIGPTDPARAREEAPESLRAMFGTDVLQNAVHGASTSEEAKQKIEALFGPLDFNADGTVKGGEIQQEKEEEAEEQQQAEQQAEQQEAEQQGETQAEAQPEAQEEQGQQEEEAEGKAEGESAEEKPAEAEGENADKTEGAEEEKSEGVEKESSEPTEGTGEKDEGAGQAAQQEAQEKTTTEGSDQQEQKADDTTEQKAEDKTEKTTDAAKDEMPAEGKAEEQKEDIPAQETKTEEPQTEEAKGEEQKEESKAEDKKEEGKAEEQNEDGKTEEQNEDGKTEEQKEGTSEDKKEGEEGKTEGTQQKDDDAAAKN